MSEITKDTLSESHIPTSSGKVEKFFEYCEYMSLCGNNHRGENRAVKDKL